MFIVFGFFEDTYVGIEEGPSHTVMAGWQKGAAQGGANLIFDVLNTGITASEFSVVCSLKFPNGYDYYLYN